MQPFKYVILLWALVTIGCSSDKPTDYADDRPAQTGELAIAIRMGKLAQETIARAEAVVTASDMDTITQDLTVDGNTISGFLPAIPAGSNRLFTLNAYDSANDLMYTGSSTTDVEAGTQTTLRITMHKVVPEETAPPLLTFQGSGNGTTGLFDLEQGVYVLDLTKNENVFVAAELIDGATGSEVRFNFSSLMTVEGFGQPTLAKAFYINKPGRYLINLSSTSGLRDWQITLRKSTAITVDSNNPARFEGSGNGTTGVVYLSSGAHVISISKEADTYVNAQLIDATSGEEIRFDFSSLMTVEGYGQELISKGFILTQAGEYFINFAANSSFNDWTVTLE